MRYISWWLEGEEAKKKTSDSAPILAMKNISANKVYSFEQHLIVFMNAWLVLCNKNTNFSYLQCTRLDKTSETTVTDLRRYQI